MFPVDPWAPTIDSQSIASQLFAVSLFPYIGFLYFITKSKSAPKLTLFGFYFLLAFVGATIPAGIYAKVHYGTSLSNVDWLHGGAESLLALTNLFIVWVLAFNSDSPHLNSSKIWEFDEAHNRWLAVAELALPEDKGDPVYALSWAPNIGRPYEVVAVATHKGIGIWQVGLAPDHEGRLPVKKVSSLSGHQGEVWQMEWDMSGMTLASTGSDGMVKLWQSNLNGKWHEQATLEPVPS